MVRKSMCEINNDRKVRQALYGRSYAIDFIVFEWFVYDYFKEARESDRQSNT
jgi:hypothetical protein